MKTKLIFVLLSLPLALLSFKNEGKAKVLAHKADRSCDTVVLYAAPVLKPTTSDLQSPVNSLTPTGGSDGSRAKLQMKAYLDSLTIDGNPVGINTAKKGVKVKNIERQKRGGNAQKKNNLSHNVNNAQNSGNRTPSNQYHSLYDPDDDKPSELSAGTK